MVPKQDVEDNAISLDEDELRRLLEQPLPESEGDEPDVAGEDEVEGGESADSGASDTPGDAVGPATAATPDAGSSPTSLGQDTIDELLAQAEGGAPDPTPSPAPQEAAGSSPTVAAAPAAEKREPARAAPRPTPASAQPKAPVTVQPVQFTSLGTNSTRQEKGSLSDLGILLDVPLHITVELGRAEMSVREILALGPGSVIELDRSAGDVLDVLVNGTLIAQGEVVVVDEQFGIRLTRVFSPNSGIFEGMGDD